MPETNCKFCGKKFYAKPNWLKRGYGKYCSRCCQHQAQRQGKFIYCEICGKKAWKQPHDLKRSKSGKFFCSKSCQTVWRNQTFVGPKHPFWKGGMHQEYKKMLTKTGVPIKCSLCGNSDKRVLIVHHLDKKRNNNDVKNLIWLCLNCHFLTHHHKETI